MCEPISIALGAFGIASLGLGGGLGAAQMREQARQARHAKHESEAQYKKLQAEYAKNSTVQADAAMRGLKTRDKQRILARSMGGTLLTGPFGMQTETLGKRSLLGE